MIQGKVSFQTARFLGSAVYIASISTKIRIAITSELNGVYKTTFSEKGKKEQLTSFSKTSINGLTCLHAYP